jgi:MFS family permease
VTTRQLVRHPGLLGLLAREVISVTGSQMTWLALPWFVLTTSGSPGRMALVLAVESASLGLFGFLGGNAAARLGPRRTMLVADGVRGTLVASIPLLHAVDVLSFALLLVLAAAIAAVRAPSMAAKMSILADVVGEDERVLTEANALMQTASRVSMVVGPPLAGALIAIVGVTNVLYIDAATFAVGFALVALLVRGGGRVEQEAEFRGLGAGLRVIRRDSLLRPWSIALVVTDASFLALFAAMPVLVLARFGEDAQALGWIWGGWGLGAVVGSIVSLRLARRGDRLLQASFGDLGMVLPLWLLLLEVPVGALVAVMTASGFANGFVNAPIATILTLRMPRAVREKAFSVIIAATFALGPVALAAAAPVLESEGFVPVLIAVVAVQTISASAFAAAGMRERARTGGAVAVEAA